MSGTLLPLLAHECDVVARSAYQCDVVALPAHRAPEKPVNRGLGQPRHRLFGSTVNPRPGRPGSGRAPLLAPTVAARLVRASAGSRAMVRASAGSRGGGGCRRA